MTTYKSAERCLAKFDAWCVKGKLDPAAMLPVDVEDYFSDLLREYAVGTVKSHLIQVRAAYSYALRRGQVKVDATLDVFLPKQPDVEPETRSQDDLSRIYAAIVTRREEMAFLLAVYTGMRRFEIAKLAWDDIDFEHQQITTIGKFDKLRRIPMHPVLAECLALNYQARGDDRYLFTGLRGRMSPSGLGEYTIRPLHVRSGVTTSGDLHTYRRTVASMLEEAEVREATIEDLLGWSKSTVRGRHYTRVSPVKHHEAIRMLNYDFANDRACLAVAS